MIAILGWLLLGALLGLGGGHAHRKVRNDLQTFRVVKGKGFIG